MEKFPVISKNGNSYQVRIYVGESIALSGFNIEIRKMVRTFFGFTYFRKLKHYNFFKSESEMFNEYGSYVGIAKTYVAFYEDEIKKQEEFTIKRDKLRQDFREWDGKC